MAYIGRDIRTGAFRQLDDISSGFDGSDTTHTMQVNSTNVSVGDVNQILLSLGGVIQKPGTDFTVSGSTLTFTTAPAANTSFFAILLGSDNGGTVTPTDGSVTGDKVASTGAFTIGAGGTASSLAGVTFYTADNSIYTHDVSGTDDSAQNNTAYGTQAMDAITTGDNNVAIGYQAGSAITTGGNNTLIGYQAGDALTDGTRNTALGISALGSETSGVSNTAIGASALTTSNGGSYNTAVGDQAGVLLTTGDYNQFMGYHAGYGNTSGSNNIAIGYQAYDVADTENHNLAIGTAALGGSVAGGETNVAIGNYTLDALTSGDDNVAIGYEAGTAVTGGYNNVLIGKSAGAAITTGARNVFIGYQAGDGHDEETYNVGIGENTLGGSIAGGEYNTAVGSQALDGLTSGDANTAVGMHALSACGVGPNNTAVGYYCLQSLTEGQHNTGIGKNVYEDLTTGNYNTGVGAEIEVSSSGATHQITIGYGIGSNGDSNFTFGQAGNRVYNNFTSNASWTRSSDERKKQNIKDDNLGLDFINELRTVTFQWKPSNEFPKEWDEYSEENNMDTEVVMHGLIAQEVKSALDKAGVDTFGGWTENTDGMQNISREMFVFPLIKAVQELSKEIEKLKEDK